MKQLVLGSLAYLVLGQLAGCIIDSDDDSGGAHATVTWSLQALATQSPQPCPVGYDTAAVYSQAIDQADNPVTDPIIDLFNCSDGSGVTSTLPAATYAVTVAIATDDNALQYGTSVPVFVDVNTDDTEVDVPPIYTDAGHLELQWQLQDASGAPLQCSDVPDAYSVNATATDSAGTVASPPFDCDAPVGYTAGILAGSYTVAVALEDATGTQLGVAAPIDATLQTDATHGNPITDLHVVTIVVTP